MLASTDKRLTSVNFYASAPPNVGCPQTPSPRFWRTGLDHGGLLLSIVSPLENPKKSFAAKPRKQKLAKPTRPRLFSGFQVDVVYTVPSPQSRTRQALSTFIKDF